MMEVEKRIRCSVCGKFISHNDRGKKAIFTYVPDTPFSPEVEYWTHINCKNETENNHSKSRS